MASYLLALPLACLFTETQCEKIRRGSTLNHRIPQEVALITSAIHSARRKEPLIRLTVAAIVLIHLLSATPPTQAVVSTGAVNLLAPNPALADAAPSVAATLPANGASNIAIYSN